MVELKPGTRHFKFRIPSPRYFVAASIHVDIARTYDTEELRIELERIFSKEYADVLIKGASNGKSIYFSEEYARSIA